MSSQIFFGGLVHFINQIDDCSTNAMMMKNSEAFNLIMRINI